MNKSNYIQILIVGIILSTLSWLAVTVFSMNSVLSKVDTQVSRVAPVADVFPSVQAQLKSTTARVDRIADALPLLQVKLAKEELSKPVKTAILTSFPRENTNGGWEVVINVYDVIEAENTSYTIPVENKDDKTPLYTALGTAVYIEPIYCSLGMASFWSTEVGNPKAIPTGLNQNASVIMRNTTADQIINKLPWASSQGKKFKIKAKVPDTQALLTIIQENPEKFQLLE